MGASNRKYYSHTHDSARHDYDGNWQSSAEGGGRLLGLMSLAELPRRLSLNFNDFTDKGLGFNSIKGEFRFANGSATTNLAGLADGNITVALNVTDVAGNSVVRTGPTLALDATAPVQATIGTIACGSARYCSPAAARPEAR